MKNAIPLLLFVFISFWGLAQETPGTSDYNLFSCKDCINKYFVSTNSGVLNTPFGYKVGFLCKTGAYIGTRLGTGRVYQIESNSTSKTTLISVTAGIIRPVFIKDKFSMYAFIGGGYGQWWGYRWERWTKSGVEIEAGLMISHKRVILSLGANMLTGQKTYATGDGTIGLGYRF